MCKILTIINTKESNNKILQDIVDANIDELKQERCGFSVFRDNHTTFHLKEDYGNFAEIAKYNGEKVFCIHSRTSTGGDSNQNGLHLQKSNGWFWGHNGVVGGFAGVKDFSDSYYFFMSLLSKLPIDSPNNPIEKDLIEKSCQDLRFNGKGFLYNPKSQVLQWFCNSPSYITVLDGCLIITTYVLTLKKEEYEYASMLGFEWITSTTETTIPVLYSEKIDDCLLTFHNNIMIGRENVKLQDYGNYNNTNYNNSATVVVKDCRTNLTKKEKKRLKRIEEELDKEDRVNGLVDKDGNYLIRNVYKGSYDE